MNLTYKWNNAPSKKAPGATVSQKNFFRFYEENRKDIDLILAARSHHYANVTGVDADDLRSEILVRLMNAKFLMSYDPTKGVQLNTYLTNTISGIATHALRVMLHKPYWRDEGSVRYRWNQVSVADLNGSGDPEDEHMLRQLAAENTWEKEFEARDTVDTLRFNMSERDTEILECVLDGLDRNDIATKFRINRMACSSRVYGMRKNAVAILNRKSKKQIADKLLAAIESSKQQISDELLAIESSKKQIADKLLAAVESYRNKNITWCKLAPSLVEAAEVGIEFPEFADKGLNPVRYSLMIKCYQYLKQHRPEALNRVPAPPLDNIGRVINLSTKLKGKKFEECVDQAITGELSCRRMRVMIRELKGAR